MALNWTGFLSSSWNACTLVLAQTFSVRDSLVKDTLCSEKSRAESSSKVFGKLAKMTSMPRDGCVRGQRPSCLHGQRQIYTFIRVQLQTILRLRARLLQGRSLRPEVRPSCRGGAAHLESHETAQNAEGLHPNPPGGV